MVSETAYENQTHWLMFLYEVTRPVQLQATTFDEGSLEWHAPEALEKLNIPDTDRQIIWPMFWKHRGGFFAAHLDCTGDRLTWEIQQQHPPPLTPPPPPRDPARFARSLARCPARLGVKPCRRYPRPSAVFSC